MKEGIYEQLISENISTKLKELPSNLYAVETEKLDVEEAKTYLSSYISEVTRKALSYMREEINIWGDEALLLQIRTCNDIIQMLSNKLQDQEIATLKLEEHGGSTYLRL